MRLPEQEVRRLAEHLPQLQDLLSLLAKAPCACGLACGQGHREHPQLPAFSSVHHRAPRPCASTSARENRLHVRSSSVFLSHTLTQCHDRFLAKLVVLELYFIALALLEFLLNVMLFDKRTDESEQ